MITIIEEGFKGSVFIKRLIIMAIIQFFFIICIVMRLAFLQIKNFENFKNQSENNNIKFLVIPPIRGNFIDRNNNKLTNNRKSYNLFLHKNNKSKYSDDINIISNILNLPFEKINKINRKLKSNKNQNVINIINNLTWDELSIIENNSYKLKNISVEESNIREYLYPYALSHITGYVSTPNNNDIKRLSKFLSKDIILNPNYKIGKNGLELTLNSVLNGKSGYKKVEINANGIPLKEIERIEPEIVNDIKLTIDIKLQNYILEKVKNKRAGIVVMNVETGEILAMVSNPSFDGNKFVDGVSDKYWNELLNDEKTPLYNKTITGLYSPGSTFKPVVAIAALESGVWNINKKYSCKGKMKLGKTEFNCWEKKGHNSLNLVEAIERSCNTFFINLGLETNINEISKVAKNLGIGEYFDLNLNEFKSGFLPTKDWKYKYYNDVWVKGDTANTSIGQGYLLVNPLQSAVMISRIANDGYPIKPFLLYNNETIREYNKILFSLKPMFKKENLDIVKQGLYNVVNAKKGTASWFNFKNKEDYEICGKTGTAQVIATNFREEMEESENGIEEKFRNHGWFIGFAPLSKPKYSISVLVEHGGSGSVAAAPIGIDILKYLIDNNI